MASKSRWLRDLVERYIYPESYLLTYEKDKINRQQLEAIADHLESCRKTATDNPDRPINCVLTKEGANKLIREGFDVYRQYIDDYISPNQAMGYKQDIYLNNRRRLVYSKNHHTYYLEIDGEFHQLVPAKIFVSPAIHQYEMSTGNSNKLSVSRCVWCKIENPLSDIHHIKYRRVYPNKLCPNTSFVPGLYRSNSSQSNSLANTQNKKSTLNPYAVEFIYQPMKNKLNPTADEFIMM